MGPHSLIGGATCRPHCWDRFAAVAPECAELNESNRQAGLLMGRIESDLGPEHPLALRLDAIECRIFAALYATTKRLAGLEA